MEHYEYELLDSGGQRVSLAVGTVEYIKKDEVDLEPNTDETLWFSVNNPTGKYNFEIKTIEGTVYVAVLDWTQP